MMSKFSEYFLNWSPTCIKSTFSKLLRKTLLKLCLKIFALYVNRFFHASVDVKIIIKALSLFQKRIEVTCNNRKFSFIIAFAWRYFVLFTIQTAVVIILHHHHWREMDLNEQHANWYSTSEHRTVSNVIGFVLDTRSTE